MKTYKAMQVSKPGQLKMVELPVSDPGPGQVRLRVESCGVCHSDTATVEGQFPGLTLPRVPGHEVVGRIEAIGPGVSKWKMGQRVGVGFFGGQDGECEPCQRGDFVNCLHPVIPGITADGGYAVRHTTRFAMPDCAPGTLSRSKAWVVSATSACSSRNAWDSRRWPWDGERTKKS